MILKVDGNGLSVVSASGVLLSFALPLSLCLGGVDVSFTTTTFFFSFGRCPCVEEESAKHARGSFFEFASIRAFLLE